MWVSTKNYTRSERWRLTNQPNQANLLFIAWECSFKVNVLMREFKWLIKSAPHIHTLIKHMVNSYVSYFLKLTDCPNPVTGGVKTNQKTMLS